MELKDPLGILNKEEQEVTTQLSSAWSIHDTSICPVCSKKMVFATINPNIPVMVCENDRVCLPVKD